MYVRDDRVFSDLEVREIRGVVGRVTSLLTRMWLYPTSDRFAGWCEGMSEVLMEVSNLIAGVFNLVSDISEVRVPLQEALMDRKYMDHLDELVSVVVMAEPDLEVGRESYEDHIGDLRKFIGWALFNLCCKVIDSAKDFSTVGSWEVYRLLDPMDSDSPLHPERS